MDVVIICKFIALCLASAAIQTASGCRPDWVLFQGSCYGFLREQVTWPDAAALCRANGGYLAEINSQAENDFLVSEAQTRKLGNVWLGASDTLQEGTFQWTTSGETIEAFTNWYPGKPDNYDGAQHCLELREEYKHKWNDYQCLTKNTFVCEANLVSCDQLEQ
ncbi:hypothetical protein BsWGS_24836 [Bradybaena similaris]